AAEEQKRIFDAFEQADGSVTRKFGGTGLGLAISRQIVEMMGGTMSLTSAPGRGSRFSFAIPAGIPRVVAAPPAPAANCAYAIIGLHPVIRRVVCETVAADSQHVLNM